MQPIITYFAIRGRAEPIRLMLEEVGVSYIDHYVSFREWQDLKPKMPFKVLPSYKDGDLLIVESRAIYRYLARKYDLYGRNDIEAVQCDILDEAIRDAQQALGGLFWDKEFQTKADSFKKNELVSTLNNLEDYLARTASSDSHCVGESITFVDFILWNYLDWVRAFSNETLVRFPILCRNKQAIETRPNIQAYLKSDRRPPTLTVSKALFGGTPETS
ncbi:MAG: glutathione S-transferase family protein [Gammaproteobacteria bacterium]|jgi:glutathione S-transferase